MTEKRFVKGYHTIRDIKENNTYDFQVNIMCDLLNELDEKWIDEFSLRETLQLELQRVEKENEQLKQSYTELEHRHSLLHDECLDAECDRDSYQKDVSSLEKENEDLKKLLEAYRKSVEDYKYQIRKAVDEKLSMIELADNCGIDVE